jgi:peptidyl-prolyl cis-trans isomerase SurA
MILGIGGKMFKKMVLILIVAVFAFSSTAYPSVIVLDKAVAIINKEVITWSELYKAMEFEASDAVKAMPSAQKQKIFKDNEAAFLETMIDMKLQLQEADKHGITASPDAVNKAIEGIKKKHSMPDAAFEAAIKSEGFTLKEYRNKLFEQITINRLIDQEVRGKIVVSDKDIDNYMKGNKDTLKDREGYSVSHIFFKKTDDKKKVEDRAAEAYQKLKSGGDFAEVARQYSEDLSARSGGDLGFIKRTDMSKEFLDIISTMKQGDISLPFWSGNGLHILKLNETIVFTNPQEEREILRRKIAEELFQREYKSWIKSLRENSYVEIKL